MLQRSTIFQRGLVFTIIVEILTNFLFHAFIFFQMVMYCIYVQRRRDRINEKMRALQELIPRCNKVVYDLFFEVLFFFFQL